MTDTLREGGCSCGHVRYRVAGEPISGAARLTQGRGSRPSLLLWSALVGAVVLGAVLAAAGLSSG